MPELNELTGRVLSQQPQCNDCFNFLYAESVSNLHSPFITLALRGKNGSATEGMDLCNGVVVQRFVKQSMTWIRHCLNMRADAESRMTYQDVRH